MEHFPVTSPRARRSLSLDTVCGCVHSAEKLHRRRGHWGKNESDGDPSLHVRQHAMSMCVEVDLHLDDAQSRHLTV
jgi:hypothetical protein